MIWVCWMCIYNFTQTSNYKKIQWRHCLFRRHKKVLNQAGEGSWHLLRFGPENPLETIDSNDQGDGWAPISPVYASAIKIKNCWILFLLFTICCSCVYMVRIKQLTPPGHEPDYIHSVFKNSNIYKQSKTKNTLNRERKECLLHHPDS